MQKYFKASTTFLPKRWAAKNAGCLRICVSGKTNQKLKRMYSPTKYTHVLFRVKLFRKSGIPNLTHLEVVGWEEEQIFLGGFFHFSYSLLRSFLVVMQYELSHFRKSLKTTKVENLKGKMLRDTFFKYYLAAQLTPAMTN